MIYFAYGSNMNSVQMKSRISSATPIGCALLQNKKVVFNKKSIDGSGKANLVDCLGNLVWGVLYEMSDPDITRLDEFEKGYDRFCVEVLDNNRTVIKAVTYHSNNLIDDATAYESYKSIIVNGAREHQLPESYIDYLESLPAKPNP